MLRGPQGTLFGNNTLGGAINVITRQPSNEWTGRFDTAIAGNDNYASVSGTVSGPIVKDVCSSVSAHPITSRTASSATR